MILISSVQGLCQMRPWLSPACCNGPLHSHGPLDWMLPRASGWLQPCASNVPSLIPTSSISGDCTAWPDCSSQQQNFMRSHVLPFAQQAGCLEFLSCICVQHLGANRGLLHDQINTKTANGSTALHNAATNGHDEIVRLLLSHECAVNARALSGATALYGAASGGNLPVVRCAFQVLDSKCVLLGHALVLEVHSCLLHVGWLLQ